MEALDLESIFRATTRPFDRFCILDWYDGALSAIAVLDQEAVAVVLQAIWADRAFPQKETYLYQVFALPYAEVTRWLPEQTKGWFKPSEELTATLSHAQPQTFLLQLDLDYRLLSVWRPVEPDSP